MPERRVLIIEDSKAMRASIRQTLEDAEYSVSETCHGRDGLDALEKCPADLVITDIIMPVMEGFETIVEISNRFPNTRILAISGGGSLKEVNLLGMARRLGAHGTLAKPFTEEALLAHVRQALGEKSSSDPARTRRA